MTGLLREFIIMISITHLRYSPNHLNHTLPSTGAIRKASQMKMNRKYMTGKENRMNKVTRTGKKRTCGLSAVLNLWKGEKEDTSRNVGYYQMVDGIKYYFEEFGFYSMSNKKHLNILD